MFVCFSTPLKWSSPLVGVERCDISSRERDKSLHSYMFTHKSADSDQNTISGYDEQEAWEDTTLSPFMLREVRIASVMDVIKNPGKDFSRYCFPQDSFSIFFNMWCNSMMNKINTQHTIKLIIILQVTVIPPRTTLEYVKAFHKKVFRNSGKTFENSV